jgi:ATP-dependent helicase HepA
MNSFAIGQRWASTAETELGLGVVTEADHRRVTLLFPIVDEHRTYAIAQAPLNRIQFDKGDTILTREGVQGNVLGVENNRGYLIYLIETAEGQQQVIPEVELADQIVINNAKDRLINGHTSKSAWFYLRSLAAEGLSTHQQSPAAGLLGARIQMTPHQFYIAQEVGQRFAPRVMLADEVGLGKTIEAGLILHQQLYTGRAQRALIIVPDALCHQWLVEMLRKFNLRFSLLDADRCAETDEVNPFLSEQLILIPQSLTRHRTWIKDALACDWDLVIVDEAHHYQWTPEAPSDEYQILEAFCQRSKGVLLLSATPEQLGIESHFARLRLLDPHRYNNLDLFKQEERDYQALMLAIEPILDEQAALNASQIQVLERYLGNQPELLSAYLKAPSEDNRRHFIKTLLDRHGTGRILFRNTRQRIKGFPKRTLMTYPLDAVQDYDSDGLYPETLETNQPLNWVKKDPRIDWLADKLKSLKGEKVLIICHFAKTAITISEHFNQRVGIAVSAFHEHLSLIERDRAAAYFAKTDQGASALICSEIGSEGRNFQFAHHLVLFDLPQTPDLLEQRIGRLDRIGQSHDVQIHLPYIRFTASETLFRWYHEALQAFEAPSTTASLLHQQHQQAVQSFIDGEGKANKMESLFRKAALETQTLAANLSRGRDRLLELNSFNPKVADQCISSIIEQETTNSVKPFVELAFDCLGYDTEDLGQSLFVVRPGTGALTTLPGIDEEGVTCTFSRQQALHRDDVQLITWEHPFVNNILDVIFTQQEGSASVMLMNHPEAHNGAVFLECLFRPRAQAPREYQIQRFLPDCSIRILIDDSGELNSVLGIESIEKSALPLKGTTQRDIINNQRQNIEFMFKHTQHFAEKAFKRLITASQDKMLAELNHEVKRLTSLKEQNPLIRPEEVDHLQTQAHVVHQALQGASLHLDAIRLIINFQG